MMRRHGKAKLCLSLAVTFALAGALASPAARAQDRWATMLGAYGQSSILGVRAYVTKDSHLYSARMVGDSWIWTDLGKPVAGVHGVPAASTAYPAVSVSYVFVTGNDGHLYLNVGDDLTRIWQDLGKPPGTTVAGDPASDDDTGNVAMVRGADGSLYARMLGKGGGFEGWHSVGHPAGVLVTESPAAFSVGDGSLAIFRGSDGALYAAQFIAWYKDPQWNMSSFGAPPGTKVRGSPALTKGIIPVTGIAFVRGEDGGLYRRAWDGDSWVNEGTSPAGALGTNPGITVFGGDSEAQAFLFYAFAGCDPNPPSWPFSVSGSRALCLADDWTNIFYETTNHLWMDLGQPAPMLMDEAPSVLSWHSDTTPLHVLSLVKTMDGHVYGDLLLNRHASWFDMGGPP